jgi:hypothetical protein
MPRDYQYPVELRHLVYFRELARQLHFRKAAETLAVAQPALSRALAQLEAALGTDLLNRTRRGAELTNHVNLRVAAPYTTMLHHERVSTPSGDEVGFCFLVSEQLEPIVIVVAVHGRLGRLERLEPALVTALEVAIQQFKTRFGLQNESYAYTCLRDRQAAASCHSRHFHLKIRIPTEMYLRLFPAAQVLGNNVACLRRALQPFKQRWEPLAYKFSAQSMFPWDLTRLLVLSDIL